MENKLRGENACSLAVIDYKNRQAGVNTAMISTSWATTRDGKKLKSQWIQVLVTPLCHCPVALISGCASHRSSAVGWNMRWPMVQA